MDPIKKLRGDHVLNVYVSYELKSRLVALAKRHDRTTADILRAIIKIGIPVMEGVSEAEEQLCQEYIGLFRKLHPKSGRKG
jgi:predicted DNA-binding protein